MVSINKRTEQIARAVLFSMGQDLENYQQLSSLLEAQHKAILGNRSEPMSQCAIQIDALCQKVRQSVDIRQRLLKSLSRQDGERVTISKLRVLAGAGTDQALGDAGLALTAQVARCQKANLANGMLLRQKQQLLQRITHGESHVYAAD